MRNFVRVLRQNRRTIIRAIIAIAFFYLIIQLVNYVIKSNEGKKMEELLNSKSSNSISNVKSNNDKDELVSNKSAITGKEISTKQLEEEVNVISNFINYCNTKDLEKAYSLLTDECKKQMYSSLEIFEKTNYDDVFGGASKTFQVENWVGNIYKVDIKEDALATGKVSGYSKQDYMTIQEVNGEKKININNYIGYKKIDKTTSKDNISVNVVEKNTYKDYEEYTIKVTNSRNSIIQLDSTDSTNTLYLEDDKGLKYYYYNHELTNSTLTIAAGQTKEVTIKFYNTYVSTKKIDYIVFNNIISLNGQLSETLNLKAKI